MGIYSDKAGNNFRNGYNCAQAVLLAFARELHLEESFALKLASSFGGGMGRLREVCGAVSAMFMIAGILKGYTEPNNDELKAQHYKLIQQLGYKFKSRCGSIICRELLGLPEGSDSPVPSKRTDEYYEKRPCENCIRIAAEIVETELLNKRSENFIVHVDRNQYE